MNIERGAKRLSIIFVAIVWLMTIAIVYHKDFSEIIETTMYLSLFTVAYFVFFRSIVWALKGFAKD